MLWDVFSISLSMSVVIAVLIIVSPFLNKRYTAKWRYFVWLILAIRLIIPLNISLPKAPVNIAPPTQTVVFRQQEDVSMSLPVTIMDDSYIAMGNQSPVSADYAPIITVEKLLGIVWFLGFAVFLLYRFVGYFMFRRKIKHWCKVVDDGKPKVLICRKIVSPMLIGFIKPAILLPNIEYSKEDMAAILAHETAHYKRKDLWYKLLMLLANAMHWFNPFVYAMVHFANKDMELSCDDVVVKNKDLQFRKAYSNTILNTLHSGTATPLSTYFKGGKKTMKQRFSNILDMKGKKKGTLAFTLIFIVTIVAGTLVACNNANIGIIGGSDEATAIFVANSDRINDLYSLKGTLVGDNSKVVKIIDLSPHEGFERGEVKLHTDKAPYSIEISYKQIGEYNSYRLDIDKTAAMLFALVDNVEFVKLNIHKFDNDSPHFQEFNRQSITKAFQNSFDYEYATRTKEDFDKFYNDLMAYQSPYYVDTTKISSLTYVTAMEYLYSKIIAEYSKYYVMLGFEVTNYKEEWNGDDFTATFFLRQKYKNFYKDPDTVEYIRQSKDNGSPSYPTLRDEYNEPSGVNYDIKVTAKRFNEDIHQSKFAEGGRLDTNTIKAYHNQSPKASPDWVAIEETFPSAGQEIEATTPPNTPAVNEAAAPDKFKNTETTPYDEPKFKEVKYNYNQGEGHKGVMHTYFTEQSTIETVTASIESLGQSQHNSGSAVDLKNKFYVSQYDFTERNIEAAITVTPDVNGNITLYFDGIANRLIDIGIQEKDDKKTEYWDWSMEVANSKAYSFGGFNKSKEYVVTLVTNGKYMWGENKGRFIIY